MDSKSFEQNGNLDSVDAFWRAATYTSVAMLYLTDNLTLSRPIEKADLKERVVGHWGCTPSINLIYAHLSDLVRRIGRPIELVVGTGHAGPSLLSCLYIDGSLGANYPELKWGSDGLKALANAYGTRGNFFSEISARVPGTLAANGELGSALAIAHGSVFDRQDAVVVCIVGDGEIETGPTACAWWGSKYLHPSYDGTVLPVINLNGWRMGAASILGMMDQDEVEAYLYGVGWIPIFCGADHQSIASAFSKAWARINHQRQMSCYSQEIRWPVVVLRAPKGYSGPSTHVDGRRIEGSPLSHKAPLIRAQENDEERRWLERWLKSYRPEQLFDASGRPNDAVLRCLPPTEMRIGRSAAVTCAPGSIASRASSDTPPKHAAAECNSMNAVAGVLKRVLENSSRDRNFRIFCPDELQSNRLSSLLQNNKLSYGSDGPSAGPPMGPGGRITEILSEHNCMGWLVGYTQSGRYGVLVMYEAFASIVATTLVQHAKFLTESMLLEWRPPKPSINIVLTSLGWHNVYSHQNPDFVSLLAAHEFECVTIYLPISAQVAAAQMEEILETKNCINVQVQSKQCLQLPLAPKSVEEQIEFGFGVLEAQGIVNHSEPDIVLTGVGDVATVQAYQASLILQDIMPTLKIRLAGVSNLDSLIKHIDMKDRGDQSRFIDVFTSCNPVLFAFNGLTSTLKSILFECSDNSRFRCFGFSDGVGGYDHEHTLSCNDMGRCDLAKNAIVLLQERQVISPDEAVLAIGKIKKRE